jgi:hypothetical protein
LLPWVTMPCHMKTYMKPSTAHEKRRLCLFMPRVMMSFSSIRTTLPPPD